MKKFCVFLLIIILCSSFNFAQSKKAISILGDSYSTFEGYLQPDTNTICNTGYRKADYSDRSFITRMDELGCPDIIFIFGATNDCWAGAPLGEYKYERWAKEDLYQFRPAMAYMLDHMIDCYPNVEIYFLLNSDLKEEFNESVRTICKHYDIDCIELYNIDKQSGHPSVKGMEQICDQIKRYCTK